MSSTNVVNFSLRQNKAIERSIVFDGLAQLVPAFGAADIAYVGLGSVWFADFHLAHRVLGINAMVSAEEEDIIFRRAHYSKPYKTITVAHGRSDSVLPQFLDDGPIAGHPWITWLDYDHALDEDRLTELRRLTETLAPNSCLLVTFSATPGMYGRPASRRERVLQLLGDAVTDVVTTDLIEVEELTDALAIGTLNFLRAAAFQAGRPGGFVPAFSVKYRDGTPMVTVGGVLPSVEAESDVLSVIDADEWPGFVTDSIDTPPLTSREVLALQAALPTETPITREQVQAWGFDLSESAIAGFSRHYLRFPYFAQVLA